MWYTVKMEQSSRNMTMKRIIRKVEIPTVFLRTGEYGRTVIAGWSYDRDLIPKGVWHNNARLDWEEQIVDFTRRFPIKWVWVRHNRRPLAEYTLEAWAQKYKRVGEIALILTNRELSVPHRSITRL